MPLLNRGGDQSRSAGRRKHASGFWRLLACTEGSRDRDEDYDDNAEARRRAATVALERRKRKRRQAAKAQNRKSDACSGRRRRRSSPEGSASSSSCSAAVKPPRRSQHCHMAHYGGGGRRVPAAAAEVGSCCPGEARRKRRKRLVVAMLEDGDEDEGTAHVARTTDSRGDCGGRGGGDGGGGGIRMRATRNERSIRRILQQLSVSLAANEDSLEFATVEIPKSSSGRRSSRRSPNVAATSRTMTMQASPLARPPLPPQRATVPTGLVAAQMTQQMPLQMQPQPQPQQLQPLPHQLQQSQPQQQQQQQQQQQPPQQGLLQQLQQLQNQQQYQPAVYAGSQHIQQTVDEKVRGSVRRGYRLFRRVFSAADNYYAVPFPPLETIKLNEDDDQWEDLEIYVASHKGMVSLKPQLASDSAKRLTQLNDDHTVNKTSAIPRPNSHAGCTGQRLQQEERTPASSSAAAASITAGATASGDHAKMSSLQSQMTQHQKQQQQPSGGALASKPEVHPKTYFGYKQHQRHLQKQQAQQKQQQQLASQQRRADPLNPNRLLSQLNQQEQGCKPLGTSIASPVTTPPRPPTARASQLPRCRWDQPVNVGNGSRYGKLNAKLP